ncbi:hypothetical protein IFR04_003365 [Cadophora malorum]|uniref:Xylanolytic transcriptional activator regulatory domain-containing protein n=1 Tax=Cadophora malorum TaxID=108018 RepID=A0A8H7WEV4_9HELO|nr:hypothetical protein IFR04_003365 [Cadophora malorum]
MYDKDCTYTAPSRTPVPKKRRSDRNDDMTVSNMQGRLRQLESLVQQMSERLDVVEKRHEVEPPLQHDNVIGIARVIPLNVTRSEGDNTSPKALNLPPMDLVLPVVQIYLQDFNSILPLFHAGTLLRLTHDFYSVGPLQRDPIVWAAINVVLALARRHHLVTSHDIPSVAVCLSRAETVFSRLVLGDNIQLLNIQVLVGMVMLLQAAQDIKPALILITTTIRLAHEIRLHDQTYSTHLDAPQMRQRAYVFWLVYILDKDLSMRSKQASIQIDDDINLELPSQTVLQPTEDPSEIDGSDGTLGVMTTADGAVKMNYFTARIQLAAVEGAVYDYIYSTHSRKRSPEERAHALQSVASALEQWKASIPSEFTASAGSRRVALTMLRFLRALHSTSLTCTTLIYQAHAWDVEWVASVRRYGSQGIQPLLPPKWDVLVGEARDLLVVFGALGEFDRWNFW